VKPILLRTDPELCIIEAHLAEIRDLADVVTVERDDADLIALRAREATVVLTCYGPVSARAIEQAPALRGIVKYGVGVDNIDLEAATARGVVVANAPDYGSDTVADHAFALLIALARRLPAIDLAARGEAWRWPRPALLGVDLAGKTMGMLGLGRIGRAMARRARGFGMRCLACDPYVDDAVFAGDGVERTTLDGLLAQADFLSVHCVLTDETRGMLGAAELAALKPGSLLINVSRAAVVDEAALLGALDSGHLAGAGLDVFWSEPLPPEHPLLGRGDVILTPHLAWYTREAFERVERDTLESVLALLHGRLPPRVRNPGVLDHPRVRGRSPGMAPAT
jgi:D-3-phosphoglycerate dehydrogenase